jgi:hypothetical protein
MSETTTREDMLADVKQRIADNTIMLHELYRSGELQKKVDAAFAE